MSSNSNIIPFHPPHLMTARRKAGFVDVSSSTVAAHNKNKNKNNNDNDNDDASSSEEVTGYFHRGWDNAAIAGTYSTAASVTAAAPTTATEATTTTTSTTPSPLERNETMSGRIIEITTMRDDDNDDDDDDDDAKQPSVIAFWLQRKLGHQSSSSHGLVAVRLGYKLRPRKKQKKKVSEGNDGDDSDDQNNDCRWELDTDESGRHTLVRVHILHNNNNSSISTVLLQQSTNNKNNQYRQNSVQFIDLDSPLNELSALQMIARHTKTAKAQAQTQEAVQVHVAGTNLIATSEENRNIYYTILPYYRDGTLLQFCQSSDGRLEEPLARFIFRQIVQGLKTLKTTGLCHRNLSLDAIAMDGDHLEIISLGWALRYNNNNNNDEHLHFPPTPGGSDPHFIAPESYHLQSSSSDNKTTDGAAAVASDIANVWNGFRDDLWAAGLVLYSMAVGTDALFSAPIAGDKIFTRLCIKGDIRGEVERYAGNKRRLLGRKDDYSNSNSNVNSNLNLLLSDDLIDLLQSMLRADPKLRLSLEEVMEHPWVTNDDPVVTPTEWTKLHRSIP